ncbi:uncharacterized protein MYCFIDRAFT_60430 [Pseudocercospora fijiensis CIRAD86]|uniref:Heme haloperoxidase family profile domain-containing protein n=1 Tax=Pseudocercospora fijiensis (strain CIRAD86) TaxID=383855 RepID=M2ZIJ7_PSEFD|nr:uncharacterized protein MYCFIDRAFT_60430 [Pseudocercospora fijiensis CIRAD86]EME78939.1 hypothetical protein MYCFIDRAFT_60430 [Pseudocercospora fijiensis CIRAD86]
MHTHARFPSFVSLSLVSLALLFGHVIGFAYLADQHHEHHRREFIRHFEERIPNPEQQELFKRQLAGLLGAVSGAAGGGGGGDPLSALSGLTGSLPLLGGGSFTYGGGFIEVTGAHAFVPPSSGDQRGPCPGLNAAANHNYIAHNGVVGLFEVVHTINQLYGVGIDIALANALMAVLSAGDPITLTWSIGGPDTKVGPPLGGLLGLLGEPQGLDFAHNLVEADCSLTRNDLFDTGDAWTLDINLFHRLYNSVPEGRPFTFHDMGAIAARRFHECIATSPNFYFGPVSGMVVANAAKIFAARLFANYTDPAHPEGVLTHDILKSFFGICDYPRPFTYNIGWERIPERWTRRPGAYGLLEFNFDLIQWIGWFPELASIGGNMGRVNTFAGIRLDDLGGGIMNLAHLLEGNNLICFALELIKTGSPSFTNNLFKTFFDLIATTVESIGCPQIAALTKGGVPLTQHLQSIYPGAAKAKSGL